MPRNHLLVSLTILLSSPLRAAETPTQAIDRLMVTAWARDKVQPAPLADDAEFVRRLYLDLIGRIPTKSEAVQFTTDANPAKRAVLIDALLASGEFPKHWRENLHALFMNGPTFGGNPEWRTWLENSLQQNKKWDALAREMLRARPEKPEEMGAAHFLVSRFAQGPSGLDLATRDVSRFFFGVDIQCARCHKHPEVNQWKQESYWGMAAFWNRSYPLTVKGKMFLAERATGEVEYVTKLKGTQPAPPRFLTGVTLVEPPPLKPPAKPPVAPTPGKPAAPPMPLTPEMEDPAAFVVAPEPAKDKTRVPLPKFSRREKLIETAINTANPYFKRAAVNYFWSQLFGRGLVEPIDQMHDGNPPTHPEVLNFLADDFALHQFDVRHLLRVLANSRVYQLSSRTLPSARRPADAAYACSAVRPLTLHQEAVALTVAVGYLDALKASADPASKSNSGLLRAKMETQYQSAWTGLVQNLDSGATPFQPGIREALYQANNAAFAAFLAQGGLVARLAAMADDQAMIQEAFLCILSRQPSVEEAERLRSYVQARTNRRAAACEQIVWALASSAEFRFNH